MVRVGGGAVSKLYLYNEGDECTDVTGGWEIGGYSRKDYAILTGEKQSNALYIGTIREQNLQSRLLGTANAIDLSGYSKLWLEYLVSYDNVYNPTFAAISQKSDFTNNTLTSVSGKANFEQGSTGTLFLDVSAINQQAYVCFYSDNTANVPIYAYKIWLE